MSTEEQREPAGEAPEEAAIPAGRPAPAPAAPRSRAGFWFGLLMLPAVLLIAWGGFPAISRGAGAAAFPYQLDREEGFLLDQAMRLARGESIYQPIDQYPFVVGNYPPVYPMMFAGAVALAGPALPLGRGLVLLSVLVILATAANIVLRAGPGVMPAFAAMALILANWEVVDWIAYARADFPAIAFSLAGLAAATWSRRWWWILAAAVLFLFAFYTKPTQAAAAGAVVLALLWAREWRAAGLLCALMAVGGIGVAAAMQAATGGEFLRHVVVYNANEWRADSLPVWARHLVLFGGAKLLAAALALAVIPALRRQAASDGAPGAAMLLSAAFFYTLLCAATLPSVGKVGSAGNYLIEFQVSVAVLLGVVLARLQALAAEGALDGWRRAAAGGLLALLLGHGVAFAHWGMPRLPPPPPEGLRHAFDRVQLRVQDTTGPMLADYPVFLAHARREVHYEPFIMSQLAREGRWDPSPFIADLADGRFVLIIANSNLLDPDGFHIGWTPEMLEAIRGAYRLDDRVGPFYLLVPQSIPMDPEQRIRLIRSMARGAGGPMPVASAAPLPFS